jgi:hypothetical protein
MHLAHPGATAAILDQDDVFLAQFVQSIPRGNSEMMATAIKSAPIVPTTVPQNPRSRLRAILRSGLVLLAALLAVRAFAQSDPPLHYYDTTIGQTGAALKSALHEIIKGHTVLPYTSTATDTWDALMDLDEAPSDPASVVLIYSGAGKWDREHLWPQSYGLVATSANSRAKTDLFNLRPIDYTANATRGNLYYDTTTTPFRTIPEAPGSSYDTNSWEPRDPD